MSEGPTIGDWTQYGWIPDGASSFPAMVRLRNAAWMVYYEPGTVVQRERAENVKLREELEAAKHDLQVFSMGSVQLEAENAKLRELVSDMMRAWWACDNEVCPRHDERCEKGKYCAFDECAQELGIEVDE